MKIDENEKTIERELTLRDHDQTVTLLGQYNKNLNYIRDNFDAQIIVRDGNIKISGKEEEVKQVRSLFDELLEMIDAGQSLKHEEVKRLTRMAKEGKGGELKGVLSDVIQTTYWGEQIKPKSINQKEYVEAIREKDIVFCIGPAGTGKTYLAVAMGIEFLKKGKVKRMILTRPAVEAGEELGFLPGDMQAKVNPYLRPLYDAIYDMIPGEEFERLKEDGRIEIAPLAFMRGRTLNNSFVILDEAQNTTSTQLKMFLTRLGFDSKAVITGDITQIDLKSDASGLSHDRKFLENIPGIEFIYLTKTDVVRHDLVKKIIEAYEEEADK
ncbi:MAG: PhoH family protein [Candidatus Bipolaricaulota bacterium]|nr:PhoH family protein [Candidatus Bipolaricaulota bacterium]MBS3791530.1 PhoH family protein [Candidatus Bipolaricaulota bacterium]